MKTQIELIPINEGHTDQVVRWRNKESVKQFFLFQGQFTKKGHEEWVRDNIDAGTAVQFIIMKSKTEAIGATFLKDIDRVSEKAEFGIFIGEEGEWGKGYGKQAARLILKYGFDVLGLHKIYLRVLEDNTRGIKSYLNAGFKREAHFIDDIKINNEFKSVVMMAIFNGDL